LAIAIEKHADAIDRPCEAGELFAMIVTIRSNSPLRNSAFSQQKAAGIRARRLLPVLKYAFSD
jgi:hypothetical protein